MLNSNIKSLQNSFIYTYETKFEDNFHINTVNQESFENLNNHFGNVSFLDDVSIENDSKLNFINP